MSHTSGESWSNFSQGQRPKQMVDNWWKNELDPDPAGALPRHHIQVCPGKRLCNFANQQVPDLVKEMEKILAGMKLPTDVVIGISGCPMNCREVDERDFGAFSKAHGWTVFFGGNPHRNQVANVLAENLTSPEVIKLAQKCFQYYTIYAQGQEKTSTFIARIGFSKFKKDVL